MITEALRAARLRWKRDKAGVCLDCGRKRDSALKRCEPCRIALRVRVERAQWKIAHSDCPACGAKRSRLRGDGGSVCLECWAQFPVEGATAA